MELNPLTPPQHRVLRFLFEQVRAVGRPPTLREICAHFGFASTGTARDHLKALKHKGFLSSDGSARGIDLVWDRVWQLFGIPILGRVPAGTPSLAEAEFIGALSPDDVYPTGPGLFALEVRGESMRDAGILHGDRVIVREQSTANPGEIVVAVVEGDEATIKTLTQRGKQLYLEPANPEFEPIPLNGGRIVGRVIQVVRKY